MGDTTDTIKDKLAVLRAAFAGKIAGKLIEIEAAVGDGPAAVQSLAHKLAGSAGTHGFTELGQTARKLELACESILERGGSAPDDDATSIHGLIIMLHDVAKKGPDDVVDPVMELPQSKETAETSPPQAQGKNDKNIILVDDDAEQSEFLKQLLSNFGFTVHTLSNPLDLAAAISSHPPAAVIMDIIFPDDRDAGLTTISQLRADGSLTCPVIFMSVREDFQAHLNAIRSGSNGYLTKPVNIIELVETLERLIDANTAIPLRVLIVDDDPEITEFCTTILEARDLVAMSINDPLKAVDAMQGFNPDVIVLDIEMPDCDGFEVASVIRQMGDRFLQVPILYLTVHTDMENKMRAAHTGSEDFLSKPINPELLLTSIIARAERSRTLKALFQRLRSGEERFSSITRTAIEAIVSTTDTGVILTWNESAEKIFGYKSREILGKSVTLLMPERYRQAHQAGINRVREGGTPKIIGSSVELHGLRKSGQEFPLEISLSSWTSAGRLFFAATMRDITERHEAESAVRDSEKRFRAMVENAGDAIYIHDRYGSIHDVNQVACNQTGYTRDELLTLSVAQLDVAVDFEKLRGTWDLGEADPALYPLTLETAHRRKDGTTFPIEVRISLLPNEGDVLFVAMVRDITERKMLDKELANKVRELDFQKSALDEHAIVSIADTQGDITYVNDKFCEISGYTRDELLGQNHRIVRSDEHSPAFYNELWQTISQGKAWNGEIKNLKKGGGYYWVDATIVPFLDDQGKPFQYIAIRTDITARVEATQLADAANQAKSTFLSSMSHELRTPMNAILGFSQMLEFNPKEPLTKAQKDCVDHIMKGGHHLLELINDILDLAKIEAGKVDLSIEDISTSDIIADCLMLVTTMAESRGISISGAGLDGRFEVRADYTRLKQVLLNLMSNAVKYNRENGSVTFNIEKTDANMARIAITDTGDGISADKQGELFKPFSRLDMEQSEIEGTGIGLVVCKNLIELMSGSIGMTSEVGKGSTFWIEMPLAESKQKEDRARTDATEVTIEQQLPDMKGVLLYVEDNPANLGLMELIVSRIEGLSMISAHNGELGIELARANKPDLIILDINLPGMSGIDVLRELRQRDETKNIPVLALSAAVTKYDIDKGIEAGFQRYLAKPIKVTEIADAIKTTLGTS